MAEREQNSSTNNEDDLSRLLDLDGEGEGTQQAGGEVPNSETRGGPEQPPRTEPTRSERDIYDEMLDNDPALRAQVKDEMRRRLSGQPQQQQGEQRREPTRLEQLQGKLNEAEQFIDDFLKMPEEERVNKYGDNAYAVYEQKRTEAMRLSREESTLMHQESMMATAALRAGEIVDSFITEAIDAERRRFGNTTIDRYQNRVRELAKALGPEVKADPTELRKALEYYVLPNAKSEYLDQQRLARHQQGGQRRQSAQDHAGGEAYMDGGNDGQGGNKDPYADLSPEERDFMKRMGLIQETPKDGERGLIPIDGGFVIPVTEGRRNKQGGGQGGSQ